MFLLTSKQLEKQAFLFKSNLKLKINRQTFLSIFFLGGPIYRIQSIEMTRQHMQIHRKTAQRF